MRFELIMDVLSKGNNRGSALRELLAYAGVNDNDLSKVTDEKALEWLKMGMTTKTTREIAGFSTDANQGNALEALMDWYGVTALRDIPESAALEFLEMLKSGKVEL